MVEVTNTGEGRALAVEGNGINVISDAERKGRPADVALRRRDYAEAELYEPAGRYGDVQWTAVALVAVATVLGWGLVTNANAAVLSWQGYLLGPFGLGGREGA